MDVQSFGSYHIWLHMLNFNPFAPAKGVRRPKHISISQNIRFISVSKCYTRPLLSPLRPISYRIMDVQRSTFNIYVCNK